MDTNLSDPPNIPSNSYDPQEKEGLKHKVPFVFFIILGVAIFIASIAVLSYAISRSQAVKKKFSGYQKLAEIKGKDAVAYKGRADVYASMGNLDAAISDYTKAIEINPGYAQAYNSRADLYYQKRLYDKYRQDKQIAKALGLNVTYEDAQALKENVETFQKEPAVATGIVSAATSLIRAATNRSPQKPLKKVKVLLEGVFVNSSGQNSAIINGIVYVEGESIQGLHIDQIAKDYIQVKAYDGQQKIKVGENVVCQTY